MKTILFVVYQIYLFTSFVLRFFIKVPPYQLKDYNDFKTPILFFEYLKSFGIKKYKKELFDNIANPLVSLKNGFGDCDDYAAICSYFFPHIVFYKKTYYYFKGLYFLYYNTFPNHACAIWESVDGRVMLVSTQNLRFHKTLKDAFESMETDKRKIKYFGICNVSSYPEKFNISLEIVKGVNK